MLKKVISLWSWLIPWGTLWWISIGIVICKWEFWFFDLLMAIFSILECFATFHKLPILERSIAVRRSCWFNDHFTGRSSWFILCAYYALSALECAPSFYSWVRVFEERLFWAKHVLLSAWRHSWVSFSLAAYQNNNRDSLPNTCCCRDYIIMGCIVLAGYM